MQFTRLRLQGFKSFVEPTDLHITSGLTGIVGPNGCGKSNLVEALRWVMGENSPKRMRGSEMDDVIFGGTATRPSRNLAEVQLELDNSTRTATPEYNEQEQIIVSRQIERGSGSDYRLNGKSVRQRDVQLLFADQATGAHSTNLVGQGQIDALIRAKPEDRRQILEEASGTSGLHARRHEAELKLKGAEQNLTRVDDVLRTLDQQLRALKQQVRQASRYRNLADHIRRAEAAVLHLRWLEGVENVETIRQTKLAAEHRATELLGVVTVGNTERLEAASVLPGLRQTEAAAAAVVQKLTLVKDALENEAKRVAEATANQEQRHVQAVGDIAREKTLRQDGETAVVKLKEENKVLTEASQYFESHQPAREAELQTLWNEVDALDQTLNTLLQALAHNEAKRQALNYETETLTLRQTTLSAKRTVLDEERVALAAEASQHPELTNAKENVGTCEAALENSQLAAEKAENATRESEKHLKTAREHFQNVTADATKLKAEANAIEALLLHDNVKTEQIIDLITVTPGLENALAVALGDALTAALDTKAAMHWRVLSPLANIPSLPGSVTPLSRYINAPQALARALAYVGLVDDKSSGEALADNLSPGQILVSRDGWAWRWDGLTVTPLAKTATAVRLQQRNRLATLVGQIPSAEEVANVAKADLQASEDNFNQHQARDRQERDNVKKAFQALDDARSLYAEQEKKVLTLHARLSSLTENVKQTQDALDDIKARANIINQELASLPDVASLKSDIDDQRVKVAEKRARLAQQQSERERLVREEALGSKRRMVILEEINAWQSRVVGATKQIENLEGRVTVIEKDLLVLRQRPAEIEASRESLLTELSQAEQSRKMAADTLMTAENKVAEIEKRVKNDEQNLNQAREEQIRAEGKGHAALEHLSGLKERMVEKLNCGPEELLTIAAYAPDEAIPPIADLEMALQRYLRERENIGPVNLRADTESETIQSDIDKLSKERDDLEAAIAKLRQGIQQLNREARERLNNAFNLVNERFQVLFKRLFNGGRAYLELIDNEDPMQAGLEIFCSPPGKKMQILSLLSGGERTLTALALLFAVFQTNPSPICVLDEAEAALDESNVDRFCALVEDIAKETGTRFLIITHQRLTMARMDRLYGVTMGEKGVSQLVSVDLAGALAIRDKQKPGQLENLENAETALAEVQAA